MRSRSSWTCLTTCKPCSNSKASIYMRNSNEKCPLFAWNFNRTQKHHLEGLYHAHHELVHATPAGHRTCAQQSLSHPIEPTQNRSPSDPDRLHHAADQPRLKHDNLHMWREWLPDC